MTSGYFLPRIGCYSAMYLVTGILLTCGGTAVYTVTINTPAANVYGYSVLLAIGSGFTFQAGYAMAGVKIGTKNGHV